MLPASIPMPFTKGQRLRTAGLPEPLLAAAVLSSPLDFDSPAAHMADMSSLTQALPITSAKTRTRSAAARQSAPEVAGT